jgi:HAD superfamily hydrolase (TIGR01509 family)
MSNDFLPTIKFIYFDFDKVLASRATNRAQILAKSFGLDDDLKLRDFYIHGFYSVQSLSEFYNSVDDSTKEQEFYEKLFSYYLETVGRRVSPEQISLATKDFINTPFIVFDQARQGLIKLKDKYQLGILSNGLPSRHIDIKNSGLEPLFKNIIISTDYHVEKPSAEIYKIASEATGLSANSIALVDDEQANATAADNFGFGQSLVFTDSFWTQGPQASS